MIFEEAEAYYRSQGCEIALFKHFYALVDDLIHEQLESIRKDCREAWILCGRLNYKGALVSVDGGAMVKCPVYEGTLLAEVLATPEGLKFFHELCRTKDDAEVILKTFERLFGMERDFIRFWTPDLDSRMTFPSRAAGFFYGDGEFRVGGDGFNSYGRSRGVRVCER